VPDSQCPDPGAGLRIDRLKRSSQEGNPHSRFETFVLNLWDDSAQRPARSGKWPETAQFAVDSMSEVPRGKSGGKQHLPELRIAFVRFMPRLWGAKLADPDALLGVRAAATPSTAAENIYAKAGPDDEGYAFTAVAAVSCCNGWI
jgi:hypothetical protein